MASTAANTRESRREDDESSKKRSRHEANDDHNDDSYGDNGENDYRECRGEGSNDNDGDAFYME
jgi:hypothetical protein